MKTKEWLASHLENGDVLTAEVLLELLDSYIHKSELGTVGAGDERVVSGDAVNRAIDAAASSIIQTVRGMVSDILAQILPGMLANYVTSAGLAAALADMATKTWVSNQISGLATASDVNESLNQHDDTIRTEIGTRLQPYARIENLSTLIGLSNYAQKSELSTLLGMSNYALKTELPDVTGFVLQSVFSQRLSELNTAIAAKATSADVATAKQEAIDTAAQNTSNICALPSDFDSNGLFIRKTQN